MQFLNINTIKNLMCIMVVKDKYQLFKPCLKKKKISNVVILISFIF